MKRLKVLISAYACRPGEGSEPGVGWNIVRELSKYHDIWVLTRANNRTAIEAELTQNPISALQFIYCEPSRLVQTFNKKQRLIYLHYYLWQLNAYFIARKLHAEVGFDLVHHVTYVRHSAPSFLSLLPIPFVWGPVGGGESAPAAFWQGFNLRGKMHETTRSLARRFGELDPFVRLTAQRSVLARGTTEETAKRLYQLGATQVEVYSQLGLSSEEIDQLSQYAQVERRIIRFISIGRLLHWKGFHLGLQAFAQAELPPDAEYWIVGDGPERSDLEKLTKELGIWRQVRFWSKLSREETFQKLGICLALVHPSLHESGGMVCLEAMAAGCPVICLDLGGPALQVTKATGFKVTADRPEISVREMAIAMSRISRDKNLWNWMSLEGMKRVRENYSWEIKGQLLAQTYEKLTNK